MQQARLLRFVDEFEDAPGWRVDQAFIDSIVSPLMEQFRYARRKHGPGNTVQNPELPNWRKLAILMEEVGEVATALQGDKQKHTATELLQVAAVALMWYDSVK